MNRNFIFSLPEDAKEYMPYEDFIRFATLRIISVIFFDGKEDSDKEVEIDKIVKVQEFVSKTVMEKEFEIMENKTFRISFEVEDALFI